MRSWYSDAEYRYINSPEFLRSPEWLEVRQDAISKNHGHCECCKKPLDGAPNVDHIYPRARYPHLALDKRGLQVLCPLCNKLKCNEVADFRSPYHPYRITWWRRFYRWIKNRRTA